MGRPVRIPKYATLSYIYSTYFSLRTLALGAKAVGIGRPYLWGMGAFGQAGVDRVLEILQGELKLVMGNCGTQSVSDIDHNYII